MGAQTPDLFTQLFGDVVKENGYGYNTSIEFMKIDEKAVIPKYAHDGDMCMDISVIVDSNNVPMIMDDSVHAPESVQNKVIVNKLGNLNYVTLEPGQTLVFHTGLKCATSYGYGLKMYVRSSTGIKKKLRLANGTGIIDTAQYRGELLIALNNFGSKALKIFDKDRVAQAEVVPVLRVQIKEVSSLSETERGEGGIGSTNA